MSYLVFARKWRPQTFDDVVGQQHVTTTLTNAIRLKRVSQAYLFAGPRGVGKTSLARIFSKALNCQEGPTQKPCNKCPACVEITASNSLDVLEIDGASNRGIDEIRNLRENVKLMPMHGKYKIYIIDEVHQITEPAFNALLKTLEEPPAHVKFIFATTRPSKIPATILSRCQRFDFKRIPLKEIISKLKEIAKAEGLKIEEGVYLEVAKAADGSMRDAESILDQLNSFCDKKIGAQDVVKILGTIDTNLLLDLTEMISKKDKEGILRQIDALSDEGKDLMQILSRLIEHFRNLAVLKVSKKLSSAVNLTEDLLKKASQQADQNSIQDLIYTFYLLSNTYEAMKRTGFVRFYLEMALLKLADKGDLVPIDELLGKISKLSLNMPQAAPRPQQQTKPQHHEENSAPAEAEPGKKEKPAGNLSVQAVESIWAELIEKVKGKRMSVGLFLSEGEPVGVDGSVLKIGLPSMHRFHKESLEKAQNKELVEKILGAMLDVSLKVDFILVDTPKKSAAPEEPEEDYTQQQIIEEVPISGQDPLVESALEAFGGKILEGSKKNKAS
ncbi:MAG: DNA polymerase III subunit gamma/tau [Candidatus Omnitrophota bacterium]